MKLASFAQLACMLSCSLGAAFQPAAAQPQQWKLAGPANIHGRWGANWTFHASTAIPCSSPGPTGMQLGMMTVNRIQMADGVATCVNGFAQSTFTPPNVMLLEPGWQHFLTWPTPSNLVSVRMDAEFSFTRPEGTVSAGMSTHEILSVCNRRSAQWFDRESTPIPPPPPNVRTPFETVTYSSAECAFGTLESTTTGPTPRVHRQHLMMQIPEVVPANARLWVYEKDRGGAPRWIARVRELCDICPPEPNMRAVGRTASVTVSGDTTTVYAAMALAFPQAYAKESPLQDLWWGGDEHGGWGLNVAKNGDRLFLTLFIYDADGRPQWAVMPEGQWDPRENVYYGNLYIPRGAPVAGYDNNKFAMGAPVGTGSLSFSDDNAGHFDYTINNQSGGKKLQRFVFAPRAAEPSPYAGMWWGGLGQEGWGVSIQQQGEVMFATLYTYELDGRTTWYYMPAGRKTSATRISGELFRSSGAAWVGQHYQGSSTKVVPAGTFELDFSSADAGTMTARIGSAITTRPLARFAF